MDVKRIIKMFKTGEKSHLCQNDEKIFCSNLYRSVMILSDGEFQLTDPRSPKILEKVVEEVQKCSILVP